MTIVHNRFSYWLDRLSTTRGEIQFQAFRKGARFKIKGKKSIIVALLISGMEDNEIFYNCVREALVAHEIVKERLKKEKTKKN